MASSRTVPKAVLRWIRAKTGDVPSYIIVDAPRDARLSEDLSLGTRRRGYFYPHVMSSHNLPTSRVPQPAQVSNYR